MDCHRFPTLSLASILPVRSDKICEKGCQGTLPATQGSNEGTANGGGRQSPLKTDGATVDVPQLKATARLAFEQHEPVSGRSKSTAHLLNLVHAEALLQMKVQMSDRRRILAASMTCACNNDVNATSGNVGGTDVAKEMQSSQLTIEGTKSIGREVFPCPGCERKWQRHLEMQYFVEGQETRKGERTMNRRK